MGFLIKVLRDVQAKPWRSLLTMLGIAVGVAALVAIVSTTRNVERAQRALYDSATQADITYWVWNAQPGLATALEADTRVQQAELRREYVTRLLVDDQMMDVRFVGLDEWSVGINQFDLVDGVIPDRDGMLLDVSAARDLGVWMGDEVRYVHRSGRERTLAITGISQSPSYLSSAVTRQAVAYVDSKVVSDLLGVSGSNQLLLRAAADVDLDALARYVEKSLSQRHVQHGAALVRNPNSYVGKREIEAVLAAMGAFAAVGLLVSSMLVYNTLSAMVSEQNREIGILKTLGARRAHIMVLYIAESLAFAVPGTALGIGLGTVLGWQLLELFASLGNASVEFQLAAEGMYLGMVAGLFVSVLASLKPALRAASMTVREAIGSHGIESGFGNRAVERRVSRLRFRRLEWRMAIRNVLRRPGRSILTVSVIALSVASLLAAVSARTAVNRAIDEIYGIYAMDAWVSFSPRADVRMAPRLETLEGVSIAEPWQLADGYISLTATRFWGIPADTVLYQYALEQGRWYDEGEDDAVVISTDLAALLDLSTGDVVKIGVADKVREVRIVGLTVDNTIFLGGQLSGKVFMPPPLFAAISGRSGTGDLFAAALIGNQQQVAQDIEYRFSGQSASTQLLSDEIEAASEASSYLTFALAAMVILMSLLGALGIVNTVSLNLLDRRREIAVMRAIGARKSTLSLVYAMEGLVMGFFGWGIGLLVGVPVSGYIIAQLEAVLFDLQFSLGYLLILGAAAFAVALSSGAGVMAFVRGAKSTAEGLDYE